MERERSQACVLNVCWQRGNSLRKGEKEGGGYTIDKLEEKTLKNSSCKGERTG